jgi:hypothetical protein
MLFMACGVIKMYCRPMARRAAEIIIFMLISRLTLSMKTSLAELACMSRCPDLGKRTIHPDSE